MAMILDAFVGKCSEKLASLIEERVVIILGVKDDLKRLQRRLERLHPKLETAERRRAGDLAIDRLVRELKDVIYDADDIIDLCRIDGAHKRVSCRFPCVSCFSCIQSRLKIGNRIKSVNDRLDEISKDMKDFDQFNHEDHRINVHASGVNYRQTSPLVESDTVGRDIDNATKYLVQALVREDKQECCVYAITGMGGIGKTTLAQKIFNDQLIQAEFPIKAWVCISQNFSEIDLLKEIIRKVGGYHGAAETKSELLPLLKAAVYRKYFFLVMDDVWEANVWVDLLKNPLKSGAAGGRILVTSRDENVAKMMGAVHIHRVKQLPNDDGWELLCRRVFISGEEEDIRSLRGVGMQIVEKCDGLPLAIKAIAGVLTTKDQSRSEWEKVLRNDTWLLTNLPAQLRGALYVSYDDLPSHLKQCFLYCSLFPEDSLLVRSDLVRLWVAEGFVKTQGDSLLEELAEEYYKELVQRNLLQPNPINYDGTRCRMHDLFRSLAIFLSQDEGLFGNPQDLHITSTTKLRRLSIASREREVTPESIIEHKCLRTLLLLESPPKFENNLLVRLSFLRVLLLNGIGFESVPDSLGNLIHLRLLDLDHTSVSRLPESLGKLSNLQFLCLSGCKSLHSLPKGLTRLHSLRHLDVTDTSLSFVPKGIGRLEQLNVLKGFLVGNASIGVGQQEEQGCSLEELGSLSQLRCLYINNLERAQIGAQTLSNKPHLKELRLSCTPQRDGVASTEEDVRRIEKLFEELVPPPCLEELGIDGFIGWGYPSWMLSSSLVTQLPCLMYLDIIDCISCQQIPPLGQLPHLRGLRICGARSIITIGPEFLGAGRTLMTFPKLELLKILDMPNWEEWSFGRDFDDDVHDEARAVSPEPMLMPRLKELILEGCPKLKALPRGLRHTSIQKLYIRGADSLRRGHNLTSLTEWLQVMKNRSLEMVSHLPSLRKLFAFDCAELKHVEKLDALQYLYLRDRTMEFLPEWLASLFQQRRQTTQDDHFLFNLVCNICVLERCAMGCPDWPIIQQIPRVNVYEYGGNRWMSYTKEPFSYRTSL